MKTSREFFSKVTSLYICTLHLFSTICVPQVSKQFGTMPFNLRSMDDEKKVDHSFLIFFHLSNPDSFIDMDTLELRKEY